MVLVVSGRHTVLVLFAQVMALRNEDLSRILVWLVWLPPVLTICIWIQCLFALILIVPFNASSLIQFSIDIISLILLSSLPGEHGRALGFSKSD